ncbi:MAG: TIGR03936 family radical SAM-associated protein [Actinobacteria bacterium]|nr:TIGR03936 family radical SAM-associated protein [Actinomycetota bacterium]
MSRPTLGLQEPGVAPRVARFKYSKLGKIRFTSHRDVGRMWERALRKVAVAVAYTSGFSPRPRIAFGFALPTGAESVAEYVDIALALDKVHELAGVPDQLTPALPEGLEVTGGVLLEPSTPALQAAVASSTWQITVPERAAPEVPGRLQELLDSSTVEIEVERKGALVATDIRPGILAASLDDGGAVICDLAARGTRPADFLRALGVDPLEARFVRTQQWIDHDGRRAEPLAAGLDFLVLREELNHDVRPELLQPVAIPPPPARLARGA